MTSLKYWLPNPTLGLILDIHIREVLEHGDLSQVLGLLRFTILVTIKVCAHLDLASILCSDGTVPY